MLTKHSLRRVAAGWLIGLLFAGLLLLSACGGAAEEAPETTEAPAQEEAAAVAADTPETQEEPTEEAVAETAEEEAPANPDEEIISVPLEPAVCEAVEVEENTNISPVSDEDWAKGPEDALVTVIEFGDFQWPGCAGVTPVLEQLKEDYGDDLRLVYRQLPLLSIHDNAQITAEASEAAGAQGKFWEMHDILFERQADWQSQSEEEIIDTLVEYAEEVGVSDMDQFKSDLENHTFAEKVLAQYQEAVDAGISSTPSFVVNGVDYPASDFGLSYQGLDIFFNLMGLRKSWFSEPEQVIDPEKEYVATIETENGDIVVELYPDTAPVNVNSFAFLAENGWYNDVTFHRVLEGFVAQAGDPTGSGIGFPGYRCGDEVDPSRTFDGAGVVSLANSGPNSNGSQFFITYDAIPQLNANFTIIGRVIEGMDVAESITPRDPQQDPNAPPGDKIISITIEEKS